MNIKAKRNLMLMLLSVGFLYDSKLGSVSEKDYKECWSKNLVRKSLKYEGSYSRKRSKLILSFTFLKVAVSLQLEVI